MRHLLNEALRLSDKWLMVIKEKSKPTSLTEEEKQFCEASMHCTCCSRRFQQHDITGRRELTALQSFVYECDCSNK